MDAQKDSLALLQRENEQLRRAVDELSVLLDLSRAIGASLDSGEVMRTIIDRSLRATNSQQGAIILVDGERKPHTVTQVRATGSSTDLRPFHGTESLLEWMYDNKRPLAVNDPQGDARIRGVNWGADVRSLLCVPLLVNSELDGILTVYNKMDGGAFCSNDERLLAIIASQSAKVVENARVYEEERSLLRMREQLHLAAQIQDHLLPTKALAIAGYDVAGKSIAATEVGGDYFDFVPMSDGRLVVCLGDVSGKGLPASLLMANVQATIRLLVSMDLPATEAISRANSFLFQSTPTEKFVSFFFSVLDPAANTLVFCNAGHNPPFLLSGSRCRSLRTDGVVLGMVDGFRYRDDSIDLLPEDLIVIFSDGVTKTVDLRDEEFGDQRLIDVARRHRNESAAEIVAAIVDAVQRHGARQAPQDDLTIVVLKRTE